MLQCWVSPSHHHWIQLQTCIEGHAASGRCFCGCDMYLIRVSPLSLRPHSSPLPSSSPLLLSLPLPLPLLLQVVPLVLHNLPLKEDMEEYQSVYSCIIHLFTHHQPLVSGQWSLCSAIIPLYPCVYVCVCVCMYVCMYVCIYVVYVTAASSSADSCQGPFSWHSTTNR